MAAKKPKATAGQTITIAAPKFETASFTIVGTSPLVQHRFGCEAKMKMRATQAAGSAGKNTNRKKAPKDFKAQCRDATHVSTAGWCGIPAAAFRNAMIRACSIAGAVMTKAKMSVFIEADGVGEDGLTPLVQITKGEPMHTEMAVRINNTTTDIRARPMWAEGWEAVVRIRFDADQFTMTDVANLLVRAGLQVGILEGRPSSKDSNGMGWGMFMIKEGA